MNLCKILNEPEVVFKTVLGETTAPAVSYLCFLYKILKQPSEL